MICKLKFLLEKLSLFSPEDSLSLKNSYIDKIFISENEDEPLMKLCLEIFRKKIEHSKSIKDAIYFVNFTLILMVNLLENELTKDCLNQAENRIMKFFQKIRENGLLKEEELLSTQFIRDYINSSLKKSKHLFSNNEIEILSLILTQLFLEDSEYNFQLHVLPLENEDSVEIFEGFAFFLDKTFSYYNTYKPIISNLTENILRTLIIIEKVEFRINLFEEDEEGIEKSQINRRNSDDYFRNTFLEFVVSNKINIIFSQKTIKSFIKAELIKNKIFVIERLSIDKINEIKSVTMTKRLLIEFDGLGYESNIGRIEKIELKKKAGKCLLLIKNSNSNMKSLMINSLSQLINSERKTTIIAIFKKLTNIYCESDFIFKSKNHFHFEILAIKEFCGNKLLHDCFWRLMFQYSSNKIQFMLNKNTLNSSEESGFEIYENLREKQEIIQEILNFVKMIFN